MLKILSLIRILYLKQQSNIKKFIKKLVFLVLYYPDRYPLQLLQITTWIIPMKITKFSVKLNISQVGKIKHTT